MANRSHSTHLHKRMVITQHTHTQKHTQTHTHTHTDTSRHTHRSITAPTRLACIARTHSHTYAYHTTHTRTHARIHTTLRLQAAAAPARLAPYSTHAYMGITHTHTHTYAHTIPAGSSGPREARLYRYVAALGLDKKHQLVLMREAATRNRASKNYG
jgi:hypothetical protein